MFVVELGFMTKGMEDLVNDVARVDSGLEDFVVDDDVLSFGPFGLYDDTVDWYVVGGHAI
jgi:hypothetical protein